MAGKGKSHPWKASFNEQFPSKLYHLLQLAGCSSSVVGWLPHGRAFAILDEDRFMREVVPMFFKQTKIRSFYRQLSLWGFRRCVNERMIPSGTCFSAAQWLLFSP